MVGDKFTRAHWPRFVAAGAQHVEMAVERQNEIRLSRNRAVRKLVVVWVSGDHAKTKVRFDVEDGTVEPRNTMEKHFYRLPPARPGKMRNGLLVFAQDFTLELVVSNE